MPNCNYSPRIGPYRDGELSPSDTRELEAHLAGCSECQGTLRVLTGISALVAPLRETSIPFSLLSRLRGIPTREPWADLLPTARLLLGLSMLLLIVSVGVSTLNEQPGSFSPQGWEEMAPRDSDDEIADEPEAEITRWVVAGLTEGMTP